MKNPTEPLIYDNGGKTLDRYTVVIPDGSVISMSQNGLGINMYIGDFQRDYNGKLSHTGKRVKMDSCSEELQRAIKSRMNE